jgi:hypothetical protein
MGAGMGMAMGQPDGARGAPGAGRCQPAAGPAAAPAAAGRKGLAHRRERRDARAPSAGRSMGQMAGRGRAHPRHLVWTAGPGRLDEGRATSPSSRTLFTILPPPPPAGPFVGKHLHRFASLSSSRIEVSHPGHPAVKPGRCLRRRGSTGCKATTRRRSGGIAIPSLSAPSLRDSHRAIVRKGIASPEAKVLDLPLQRRAVSG